MTDPTPPTGRLVPDGCPLSPRQFDVLAAFGRGETPRDIAERMVLSESTIRSHAHMIYTRLGVPSVAAAIAYAFNQGWMGWTPPPPIPVPPRPSHFHLSPWAKAFLSELDRYLASGRTDMRARRGMKIALAGAENRAEARAA